MCFICVVYRRKSLIKYNLLSCCVCVCAQAKELLDHLEDVLSNKPIEVISGNTIVEAKPQVKHTAACGTADLFPSALPP